MDDLDLLWIRLGRRALAGTIPIKDVRELAATLIIVASFRRHDKVKTYAAAELGTSRRVVREALLECEEGKLAGLGSPSAGAGRDRDSN